MSAPEKLPTLDEIDSRILACHAGEEAIERRLVEEGESDETRESHANLTRARAYLDTLRRARQRWEGQLQAERARRIELEASAEREKRENERQPVTGYRCDSCFRDLTAWKNGHGIISLDPCASCHPPAKAAPPAPPPPPPPADPYATRWPDWRVVHNPSHVLVAKKAFWYHPGSAPREDVDAYTRGGFSMFSFGERTAQAQPGDRVIVVANEASAFIDRGVAKRAEDQDSAPTPIRWHGEVVKAVRGVVLTSRSAAR